MQEPITELIAKSHTPRVTDYFSQGFNIVFKKPALFILFIVLFMGLGIVVSYIPVANLVHSLVLQPLLLMGLYIAADRINYLERIDFNTFFEAFRHRAGKIVLANMLMFLVMLLPLILFVYGIISVVGIENILPIAEDRQDDINVDAFDFSATNMLILLAGLFLLIYLAVSYMLVLPMLWFKGLGPWRALEASRKLVGKHFFHVILFILFAFVVNLAGALLLGVGYWLPYRLLTVPYMWHSMIW